MSGEQIGAETEAVEGKHRLRLRDGGRGVQPLTPAPRRRRWICPCKLGPVHTMDANANGWFGVQIKAPDEVVAHPAPRSQRQVPRCAPSLRRGTGWHGDHRGGLDGAGTAPGRLRRRCPIPARTPSGQFGGVSDPVPSDAIATRSDLT